MIFLAVLGAAAAHANVRLPRSFSDHMVLQRDMKTNVWGWAAPGESISVQFDGQNLACNADKTGAWSVVLAPMKANATAQELTVTGKNTMKLSDVLVGDVWMVSGQSNAAFGLGGCKTPEDISSANFPLIRFTGGWEHFVGSPQIDGGSSWSVVQPGSAGGCSAIAYYFARKVQHETGVPIGILSCAVGGTEIECWMSPEAIYNYPENADMAKRCKESIQEWERELPSSKATGGNRPAYLPVEQPIGLDLASAWLADVRSKLKISATPLDPSLMELESWVAAARDALTHHKPVPPQPEFEAVGKWLLATALPDNLKRIPLLPHPADRYGVGGHGWFRWQTLYNGKIILSFDNTGAGLMVGKKDGRNPTVQDMGAKLQRFAIAGEDKKWVWADAVIDGKTVLVSSPEVPKPVAVRYAFSMNPEGCNLYNKEGLPASPFRTDDW